ncbi:MAG: hypothetical protein OCD03_13115 [Hyphomicrobiales bacterium]
MPVTLVNSNPLIQPIYLVRLQLDDCEIYSETVLGTKKTEIVQDLINGNYEDADQVICVNLAKGTSADVTEEFFEAVKQWHIDVNSPSEEWPTEVLGHDVDREISSKQADEACDDRHINLEAAQ